MADPARPDAHRPGPSWSLHTWLLLSHGVVLLLPVLVVVGTGALGKDLREQTREDLAHQGALISLLVQAELDAAPAGSGVADLGERLQPHLIAARDATLAGVRVLDPHGVVVASSGDEVGTDLSDRPEVREALAGATGLDVRPRPPPSSAPLDSPSRRSSVRLFLGVPISRNGDTVGAVVLSRTPREELQALYHLVPRWAALSALASALGLVILVGHAFSRSLRRLEEAGLRLAEGGSMDVASLDWPGGSRVAEVRGLAVALRTMATRLADRLAYISEFASHVSHEFRTPITTLRGSAELLRDEPDMPSDQRERFLDNALDELDRLDRLVAGLLALARAEEGGPRAPVDLDALLDGVAERFGDVARAGRAGRVAGDAAQLGAVVENLLDNALRHGGDDVRVQLVGWREPDTAGFDVVDDGPGISEANQAKVFERFFTTARGSGGTGLGLALVQTVCRAHGGHVSVQSRPGSTRFRVSLPLVVAEV